MNGQPIDDLQWEHAIGIARQTCAGVFRDGGTPQNALAAFGLSKMPDEKEVDWSRAVEAIAQALCQKHEALAA